MDLPAIAPCAWRGAPGRLRAGGIARRPARSSSPWTSSGHGRIYGLDLGKDHRNPTGEKVGEKHKHRWTEKYRDKHAYVPADITASAQDVVLAWTQFCQEASIQHDGKMSAPNPAEDFLFI